MLHMSITFTGRSQITGKVKSITLDGKEVELSKTGVFELFAKTSGHVKMVFENFEITYDVDSVEGFTV